MITDLIRIASSPAVTAPSDAPLSRVARTMSEHNVGCVVVVDDGGHLVGIVTDRDLAIRSLGRELGHEAHVSEVMTREVASVLANASTLDAARQMATRGCRRLPVLDDQGNVLGVLSLDDIYRAEGEVMEQINRVLGVERSSRGRL